MSTQVQDILVINYSGPQGSVELTTAESANVNRVKSRSRVKTMNRERRAIGFQSGTEEVQVTMTIVPELIAPEVNWIQAWRNDEEFSLSLERGLGGEKELIEDCLVSDVGDTYNEAGEARMEVTIEGLRSLKET